MGKRHLSSACHGENTFISACHGEKTLIFSLSWGKDIYLKLVMGKRHLWFLLTIHQNLQRLWFFFRVSCASLFFHTQLLWRTSIVTILSVRPPRPCLTFGNAEFSVSSDIEEALQGDHSTHRLTVSQLSPLGKAEFPTSVDSAALNNEAEHKRNWSIMFKTLQNLVCHGHNVPRNQSFWGEQ